MSDQENTTQPLEGAAAGTAPANEQAGASSSPADAEMLNKISRLEGEVNALKSSKDKQVFRNTEELKKQQSQLDRYDELMKGGMTPAVARERLDYEQLKATVQSMQQGQPVPGSQPADPASQAPASIDIHGIMQTIGIDANNPEALAAVAKHAHDETALKLALLDVASKQKLQTIAPQAGVLAASPGTGIETGSNDLLVQYERERDTLPKGPASIESRMALKTKFRNLGVNIP